MPAKTPMVEAGAFPAFPVVGEDSTPFLNTMFTIFNRAVAPIGAHSAPVGPLQYSLPGYQAPFPQGSYLPFVPLPSLQWPNLVLHWQNPGLRTPGPSPASTLFGKRKTPVQDVESVSTTLRRSRVDSTHSAAASSVHTRSPTPKGSLAPKRYNLVPVPVVPQRSPTPVAPRDAGAINVDDRKANYGVRVFGRRSA